MPAKIECRKWIDRTGTTSSETGIGATPQEAEKAAEVAAENKGQNEGLKDHQDFRCPEGCQDTDSTIDKMVVTTRVIANRTKKIVNIHIHVHSPWLSIDLDIELFQAEAIATWSYKIICYTKGTDFIPPIPK